MLLIRLDTSLVFMWCCIIWGSVSVWNAAGLTLVNRLQSFRRWRAVCSSISGQLHSGEDALDLRRHLMMIFSQMTDFAFSRLWLVTRIWRLWDRASLEQRCKQQTRYNNSVYWLFYWSIWICSTCFGRQTRPSSGALFYCIYSFGTMHRHCCSNIGALYQICIYSKKCSWRWANLSPETCTADSNRSLKISIKGNCRILFVAYIDKFGFSWFHSVLLSVCSFKYF